jgi:hypothetical protein
MADVRTETLDLELTAVVQRALGDRMPVEIRRAVVVEDGHGQPGVAAIVAIATVGSAMPTGLGLRGRTVILADRSLAGIGHGDVIRLAIDALSKALSLARREAYGRKQDGPIGDATSDSDEEDSGDRR